MLLKNTLVRNGVSIALTGSDDTGKAEDKLKEMEKGNGAHNK